MSTVTDNPPVLDHRGHPIEEWEYDVVTSEKRLGKNELNALGKGGWILSSCTRAGGRSLAYYPRRRVQVRAKPVE
jgi:hypothetical protein